jgi:hypothetical protein
MKNETAYSPTPWSWNSGAGILDANHNQVLLDVDMTNADIIRIIACVNACEWDSTEILEKVVEDRIHCSGNSVPPGFTMFYQWLDGVKTASLVSASENIGLVHY